MRTINKHAICYTVDGHYTRHHFDSIKELKEILASLTGTLVEYRFDGNTKKIGELCFKHNRSALPSETLDVVHNTASNLFKANRQ